ncbi:MAG: aminopeptidase P family N-terminal domain-containing protein, partial [Chloroflexota bacterium]|nr:aminopeptidase P family N-terminal domain-containing protein [Chloroflexota bacterium]
MANRFAERLGRLHELMDQKELAGLLAYGNQFRKDHLRYVAPFPTPSPYGFCLLTKTSGDLFVEEPWNETTPPETVQAVHGARSPRAVARLVGETIRKQDLGPRIGLVGHDVLEVGLLDEVKAAAGSVEFVPATKDVAEIRLVKDAEELAAYRRGAEFADRGYEAFVKACRPGRKQYEVVA